MTLNISDESRSRSRYRRAVLVRGKPPEWLAAPAAIVLRDLQGIQPIAEIAVWASAMDGINGLHLGIAEGSRVSELVCTLEDTLDPDEHTQYGGGNWVPRSLRGAELLVLVAEIL
jgi:hypothetical protein